MKHWSQSTDFQHISIPVASLKQKVERAYYKCRDGDAAEAQDDLLSAECRMRQAKRRKQK
ncbi:hypothetical protein ACFFUT_05630 [Pseudohalocynthiibacter aestuariivivens]|uniref:Uncharacterized protein n=1 Tax=Pseudohalocynthiibacter aestuariivivens TaxID=1591409 RepID=A0ABV5JD37_9RHOB|nr:hypothetical protein [Pseudohalocynthiibacter aestuariivivens]MBS9717246.1 hypothetical protein [Pseudohalocynthiibacter aestuariivivens]